MANAKLDLANNDQVVFKQQVIVLMNTSEERIFDRKDGPIHLRSRQGLKGRFKARKRDHRRSGVQGSESFLAVRADLSLEAHTKHAGFGLIGDMRNVGHGAVGLSGLHALWGANAQYRESVVEDLPGSLG